MKKVPSEDIRRMINEVQSKGHKMISSSERTIEEKRVTINNSLVILRRRLQEQPHLRVTAGLIRFHERLLAELDEKAN